MSKTSRIIEFASFAAVVLALAGCCCTPCKTRHSGGEPCHGLIFATQPEDALIKIDHPATFTVLVEQPPYLLGEIKFQWQVNYTGYVSESSTNWIDKPGAVEPTLTIPHASTNDVGFYRVRVGVFPHCFSKEASLSVFSSTNGGGNTITVYAPAAGGGAGSSNSNCPGAYAGLTSFKKTAAAGWGWAPILGMGPYGAADGTIRTDTIVEMTGNAHPGPCGPVSVSATTLPDTKYRFTIYFPSNPPTSGSYPIVLTGFNP
jgi:hypothetical protein